MALYCFINGVSIAAAPAIADKYKEKSEVRSEEFRTEGRMFWSTFI
jgi:hypothetical protein